MRKACLIQGGSDVLVGASTCPFSGSNAREGPKSNGGMDASVAASSWECGLDLAKCGSWEMNHEIGLD